MGNQSSHGHVHLHFTSKRSVSIPEAIHFNGMRLSCSYMISVLARIGIQHEWGDPQGDSVLYELIDVVVGLWIIFFSTFI